MPRNNRLPHFELTFELAIIIKSAELLKSRMKGTAAGQSGNADVRLGDVVSAYVFCNSTLTYTTSSSTAQKGCFWK
jgi:hypothetical protein